MTNGRMTMVARTAIDRATMVVSMSGLLDHVDDDDDEEVDAEVRGTCFFSAPSDSFSDPSKVGD